MYLSEKTLDVEPSTRQPSICFIKQLFRYKTDYLVNFINNFFKMDFLHKGCNSLAMQIHFRMETTVLLTGMLLNSDSTCQEISS